MAEVATRPPEVAAPGAASGSQPEPGSPAEEVVRFRLVWGKDIKELERPLDSTVAQLKEQVHELHHIPPALQKLMYKGLLRDETTLREAGVKANVKIMLIGSSPAALLQAAPVAGAGQGAGLAWDAPKPKEEPLSAQTQHKKVLDKGKPDDALPGIRDRQVQLKDEQTYIPGLLNSQGTKVRLTFKPELQQIWVGSATATQKVPYNMVTRIESFPIEGSEEYSILAIHLGSGGTSKYWLYWVPSQFTAAIKARILGLAALL